MKEKFKRFLATLLICCTALSCGAVLASCSCGGSSSGGKCKVCHKQTTYTYKNGGWLCYSCSKR